MNNPTTDPDAPIVIRAGFGVKSLNATVLTLGPTMAMADKSRRPAFTEDQWRELQQLGDEKEGRRKK